MVPGTGPPPRSARVMRRGRGRDERFSAQDGGCVHRSLVLQPIFRLYYSATMTLRSSPQTR